MQKIILASQSPRRKQLLEWAEVPFEVIVSDADESFNNDLSADEVPVFIAEKKAVAVQKKLNDATKIILAADTLVILNDAVIGKPADRNHAIKILQSLSGATHKVITGVAILKSETTIHFSDTTEVIFHPLTNAQIEFYVVNTSLMIKQALTPYRNGLVLLASNLSTEIFIT